MMKKLFFVLPLISCVCVGSAHANWEYKNNPDSASWLTDNGARFVLSMRGGASYGTAKIRNEIGDLSPAFFYNGDSVISQGFMELSCGSACDDYELAGYGNIGELPAREDYKKFTFAAGLSIGWVMPNHQNFRLEVAWDRMSEADYSSSPLFQGDLKLSGGDISSVFVTSGAVQSTVTTDVISAMTIYDFFDGIEKPLHKMVPYIGIGLGYATSQTEMQLTDLYGDLSLDSDLQNYGERETGSAINFYKSKNKTSNVAALFVFGVSYGIVDKMFLDFGARIIYIPQIDWSLANADDTRHREWFSAQNVIYTNLMLGMRFEF